MKTEVLEQPVVILTLAQRIGALHRDIEGRNEEMYGLLTQAKKAAGEGGWLKWLADNEEVLGFGARQARRYLREPDTRVSDRARHAEGERKRRAAAKDSKEVPRSEMPPDLVPDDDEPGVEPDVLPEIEPEDETLKPEFKHSWGNKEWNELTPDDQEEYRRATRVEALLVNLEGAANQIAEDASELTAAQRKRVAAVVKLLLNVVPVKFSVGHGGHLMIGEPAAAPGPLSSAS
jgi:hypothetical protein